MTSLVARHNLNARLLRQSYQSSLLLISSQPSPFNAGRWRYLTAAVQSSETSTGQDSAGDEDVLTSKNNTFKGMSQKGLWMKVAGLDPDRTWHEREAWDIYTDKAREVYRDFAFDLERVWSAQDPAVRLSARRELQDFAMQHPTVRNWPGVANPDLCNWKLRWIHLNSRKNWIAGHPPTFKRGRPRKPSDISTETNEGEATIQPKAS